jgi:Peptidase propeptide and YPEB domain
MSRTRVAVTASLVAVACYAPALAQEGTKLPPPNAIKLSAIVAKVEQRADFRYVERLEWDTGGYYDIIYFTTDKAKVEIKINPVSGEPQ